MEGRWAGPGFRGYLAQKVRDTAPRSKSALTGKSRHTNEVEGVPGCALLMWSFGLTGLLMWGLLVCLVTIRRGWFITHHTIHHHAPLQYAQS